MGKNFKLFKKIIMENLHYFGYWVLTIYCIVLTIINLIQSDKIQNLKKENSLLMSRNEFLNKDLQENIEILERIKDHIKF